MGSGGKEGRRGRRGGGRWMVKEEKKIKGHEGG